MAASLQAEQKDMQLVKNIEITRAQQVIAFIPLILVGVMNKSFYYYDTEVVSEWF